MVVIHGKSKRKATGGRYTDNPTKRRMQKGSKATETGITELEKKKVPTKGGGFKTRLISSDKVNLFDPKSKKFSTEKITSVEQNNANRHFERHNILTKGAVIITSKGKAVVTNRPGQESIVNAVLVD